MPGKSQRLSKEEQLGSAIGTCSVLRDDLRDLKAALAQIGVMAHCESARKTMDGVFMVGRVVERDLEHLDLLETEIGPFLSSKEVLVRNDAAGNV